MGKLRMKITVLGAAVGRAVVALAAPQDTTPKYPIGNTTRPTVSPTNPPCDSHCSVEYPELSAVRWIPESDIVYTTEMVVATVTSIIVTSANVTLETQIYTVYNTDAETSSIPPEYSLYFRDTNLAGTAIVTVAFPQPDAPITFYSTLTYPTSYVDYSTEYHWEGVLSTSDKAFQLVCATAFPVSNDVALQLHPNYPQPTAAPAPSESNSTGTEYIPLWVPIRDQPDTAFFQNAFPSESAFASCESSASTRSHSPTKYPAPKYITNTTTIYNTAGSTDAIVGIESTATGWEVTTTTKPTYDPPRLETSASGFESEPPDSGVGDGGPAPAHTTSSTQAPKVHIESTVTGLDTTPITGQTHDLHTTPAGINTGPAPDLPGIIVSLIYNYPNLFSSAQQPGTTKNINPTPVAAQTPPNFASAPIFTFVSTFINGQSTTIPAYLLPDSSSTATIGQEVTINGQPTILAAPPALLFTSVPITINGIETYSPAYILSGTSTVSLGETLTMSAATTVLAAPGAIFTTVPTTISGTSTNIPAYLIGSSTATIGQTVVLGGKTTVKPGSSGAPILKFTMITTTVSGKETTFASYVEDTTAGGGGRTEVVGGTTTVLALPSTTDAEASSSTGSRSGSRTTGSGDSSATSSGPSAATSTPGAAGRTVVSWGMLGFVGLGLASVLLL